MPKKLLKPALKIGDLVDYHSIIGGPVTSGPHTVTHEPYQPFVGAPMWVTFISDKSGYVSCAALTPHVEEGTHD